MLLSVNAPNESFARNQSAIRKVQASEATLIGVLKQLSELSASMLGCNVASTVAQLEYWLLESEGDRNNFETVLVSLWSNRRLF